MSEATGGRGRAVERAHFCVNVTLRALSEKRARATPLFRSRPNLFRSFHPSLQQEKKSILFFSPFGTAECITSLGKCLGRSYSCYFTRCRLPIQEDPLGIPLRAPQATYTKRDARYYGHSGISVLSCESHVLLSYPLFSVRRKKPLGTLPEDVALSTCIWLANSG